MRKRETIHSALSLTLTFLLVVSGLVAPVRAQEKPNKPVVISFGQPNIWSLEQAHYLLARMRDQSLDLATRMPNDEDLNPNAPNGSRLRSLRTFFGASASFDQTAGLQNKLFQDNAKTSGARRETLLSTRAQLQTELRAAAAEHSRLKIERSLMNVEGASDAQKAHKSVEVAEAGARQEQLTSDIAKVDQDLSATTVPAGALTTVTPPDASAAKLAEGVADKLLGTDGFKNELSNDVRLNASTVLENHVQMQYEIIAKQLTLLRDEVGPGERLVFLELPHSIYTVPDKANRKLAQVWWNVKGFYEPTTATPAPRVHATTPAVAAPTPSVKPDPNAWHVRMENNPYSPDKPIRQRQLLARAKAISLNQAKEDGEETSLRADRTLVEWKDAGNLIRTVDLIPRQSSLNVNDIQDKVKNFNIAGAFNFLFGLGARVDYQRQRRLYEQFMHQDIFGSAFGKGKREFGWTFGPVPGTERIAPGLHTTYAVLIVPDKAESIVMEARGCFMRRTDYAPVNFDDTLEQGKGGSTLASKSDKVQCTNGDTFTLPIPGTSQNNFWVTGINYETVKPGERAVVMIHGDYFSPQIGVLVDGVPLRKAVGVAQVELVSTHRDDPYLPEPRGEVEFVNSRQLVLAITMPAAYQGTPSIVLVTPGRARVLNDLRLVINGSYKCEGKTPTPTCRCVAYTTNPDGTQTCARLERYKMSPEPEDLDDKFSAYVRLRDQNKLFSAEVPSTTLSIGELFPQRIESSGDVRAHLTGTKFDGSEEIIVNGETLSNKTLKTGRLYELIFPSRNAEDWNITIVQTQADAEGKPSKVNVSKTFPNPYRLKINEEPRVLSFNQQTKTPSLVVKLVGSGFTPTLRASYAENGQIKAAQVAFVSSREVVLTLTSPPDVAVVTLNDLVSGHAVATVVNRPPPAQQEPEPRFKVFEKEDGGNTSRR